MIDRLEKKVDILNRHLQILGLVIDGEPIRIATMSNQTRYTHHKVRYSSRILREENLIYPSGQGVITTEQTTEFVEKLETRLDEIESKLTEIKIGDPAHIEE